MLEAERHGRPSEIGVLALPVDFGQCLIFNLDYIRTVSYTHLDVYKRQIYNKYVVFCKKKKMVQNCLNSVVNTSVIVGVFL